MFIRRDRRSTMRFLALRVGLLFFAAGLWVAGVIVENRTVTGVAIGVAAAALLLSFFARRRDVPEEGDLVEDE